MTIILYFFSSSLLSSVMLPGNRSPSSRGVPDDLGELGIFRDPETGPFSCCIVVVVVVVVVLAEAEVISLFSLLLLLLLPSLLMGSFTELVVAASSGFARSQSE